MFVSKVLDGLVGESGVSSGVEARGGSDSSVGITKLLVSCEFLSV